MFQIPGTEGRAGMAAIYDPNREVDIGKLGNAIKDRLPSYARPIFIRLVKKLDITGSFHETISLHFIPYIIILF